MSRHHRNIEEEFRAIAPRGRAGIPGAQPLVVGIAGSGGGDSAASPSQASQFRQQAGVIQANTQALQGNTTAHSGQSVAGAIGSTASHVGGGLGFLSPVVSGLLSLFGVGSSNSAASPLPLYTPPPSVQISDALRTAAPAIASVGGSSGGRNSAAASSASAAPQITVNVSAMDSQSFMDRSSDIASAVREAMLNLHPINDVVASL